MIFYSNLLYFPETKDTTIPNPNKTCPQFKHQLIMSQNEEVHTQRGPPARSRPLAPKTVQVGGVFKVGKIL